MSTGFCSTNRKTHISEAAQSNMGKIGASFIITKTKQIKTERRFLIITASLAYTIHARMQHARNTQPFSNKPSSPRLVHKVFNSAFIPSPRPTETDPTAQLDESYPLQHKADTQGYVGLAPAQARPPERPPAARVLVAVEVLMVVRTMMITAAGWRRRRTATTPVRSL